MTAFVLVHSPLVGPATWAWVASELEGRGDAVVVPSLVEAIQAGPPFTEGAVAAVVDAVGDEAIADGVVLAGHSGAGPLLPAIGAALGEALGAQVSCHVFVDAGLPIPGRSRLADIHPSMRSRLADLRRPDGTLPPWDEWWGSGVMEGLVPDPDQLAPIVAQLRPIPFSLFEEVLPVVAGWAETSSAYLRTSEAYLSEEAAAAGMSWPVSSVGSSHLALVTHAREVAAAMSQLVGRAVR